MYARKPNPTARPAAPDRAAPARRPPPGEARLALWSRAVDAGVPEIISSPGRPLDAATRTEMEARFGHDFGAVRIHADGPAAQSAARLGAHAYTVGEQIVVRDYRPESWASRAILAHELAHTIQQRGARPAAGEQAGLEEAANRAAVGAVLGGRTSVQPAGVAPPIQFLRVTEGGFGRALEEYTTVHQIPDRVVRLLLRSPLFMQTARLLDQHFVWRTDSFNWEQRHGALQYDAQHRLTNGGAAMRGKRELMVVGGGSGASFEPFDAPGNQLSSDIIVLNPTGDEEFLRSIAHEATHARNFVGQSGPPPATLAAAVTAGIQEEVDVRGAEQRIVGELAGPAKRQNITFGAGPTTVPAEVEREFSPGLGLTYLENIFFEFRLREAQAAEGLADDEASAIREQVDSRLPSAPFIFARDVNPKSGLYELSEYAEVYFNYKTAQREWAELHQQVRPGDPSLPAREEAMRLSHARRFFGGRVAYSPLPTTTP
jgi:hypothetical protein